MAAPRCSAALRPLPQRNACPAQSPDSSVPPRAAVREAMPLYPRGPWLRCGLCCPAPSSLTTTPSASLAGTGRLHSRAASINESPPTSTRLLPAILDGVMHFGAASFASCYGSHVCAPLRLLRYRVVPAFDADCRQAALGIWLDGRTGNLQSSGLSPDKSQQLVRLHDSPHKRPI
jgi:hypothetical protein